MPAASDVGTTRRPSRRPPPTDTSVPTCALVRVSSERVRSPQRRSVPVPMRTPESAARPRPRAAARSRRPSRSSHSGCSCPTSCPRTSPCRPFPALLGSAFTLGPVGARLALLRAGGVFVVARPALSAPGHDPDATVGPRHGAGHAGPGEQPVGPRRRTIVVTAGRPAGTDRREASQSARVGRGHRRPLIGRRSETGASRTITGAAGAELRQRSRPSGRGHPAAHRDGHQSGSPSSVLGSGGRGTAACPGRGVHGFLGLVAASSSSPCWRSPWWRPVAGVDHR